MTLYGHFLLETKTMATTNYEVELAVAQRLRERQAVELWKVGIGILGSNSREKWIS